MGRPGKGGRVQEGGRGPQSKCGKCTELYTAGVQCPQARVRRAHAGVKGGDIYQTRCCKGNTHRPSASTPGPSAFVEQCSTCTQQRRHEHQGDAAQAPTANCDVQIMHTHTYPALTIMRTATSKDTDRDSVSAMPHWSQNKNGALHSLGTTTEGNQGIQGRGAAKDSGGPSRGLGREGTHLCGCSHLAIPGHVAPVHGLP